MNRKATVIDETECKRCYTVYCPHAPNCIEKIEIETVRAGLQGNPRLIRVGTHERPSRKLIALMSFQQRQEPSL